MREYKYYIKISDLGRRLDLTLKDYLQNISRNNIISLIKQGKVRIKNEIIKVPSYRIKCEGTVSIKLEDIDKYKKSISIDLNIVFEDKDLIILNKPAGILTHSSQNNNNLSLVDLLKKNNKTLFNSDDDYRPGVVHRLDKDTSGLIIFAKNTTTGINLKEQFASRTIKKVYEAIVWGKANPVSGVVDFPITNYLNRKKVTVKANGKYAFTKYKEIKSYLSYFSLLECKIHTGRTHQIRVHMRSLGCPLIGDNLYAKDRNFSKTIPFDKTNAITKFKRQALHAKEISFFHPQKKKKMTFRVKKPNDMDVLERTLFD